MPLAYEVSLTGPTGTELGGRDRIPQGSALASLRPPRWRQPTPVRTPRAPQTRPRGGVPRDRTRRRWRGRTAATLPGRRATARRCAMEAGGSREVEARNYLEKHRIMELLNYLTSSLLFFRPGKRLVYHPGLLSRPSPHKERLPEMPGSTGLRPPQVLPVCTRTLSCHLSPSAAS